MPAPKRILSRPAAPRRSGNDWAEVEHLALLLKTGADLRKRKVRRLRAAVKVRQYENNLKLDIALDRMLEDITAFTPVGRARQSQAPRR